MQFLPSRGSALLLSAFLGLAPLAVAEDDGYLTPSLVRIQVQDDPSTVIEKVFQEGWDVVARGKGWIDVMLPQVELERGLAEFGVEEGQVEVRRENADDEFAPFRGREDAGAYHTYDEVKAEIDAALAAYPEMVRYESIGTTVEGRPIHAVEISAPGDRSGRTPMLVCGLHHSREWISVEVPMGLLKTLTEGYKTQEWVRNVLQKERVWIIPVVNPDGHIYSQTQHKMWRKNRQTNHDGSRGVDPNRNYGYNWGMPGASPSPGSETYRGPEAFSEPEIQAVRDLALRERFPAALSFHSYSELVLWPWGYTYDPAPDEDALAKHGREMAKFTGYVPQQSSDLYPTSGDFDDWFYGELGALAYTFELGKQFVPPESQIPSIVESNLKSVRYFLENCSNPFPALSHAGRSATIDKSGPYPVQVRLGRRFHADNPVSKVSMTYRRPGDEKAKTVALKFSQEAKAYVGSIPGNGQLGTVEYSFQGLMKDGSKTQLPAEGSYSFPIVDRLILVVDDAKGKPAVNAYTEALDAAGRIYKVVASPGLTEAELLSASSVIWFCGSDSSTTLTDPEIELVKAYLDNGGELLLFGQDIAYDIAQSPFLADYLKTKFKKDSAGEKSLKGTAGGPLAGIEVTIGQGDGIRQRYPEWLEALPGGQAAMTYAQGDKVGAVSVQGGYRLILFGVGLEGMDTPEKRAEVLSASLEWVRFEGGARRIQRIQRLKQLGVKEEAYAGLEAELLDAARDLGRKGDHEGFEALESHAEELVRRPLLRAFLQALQGSAHNK